MTKRVYYYNCASCAPLRAESACMREKTPRSIPWAAIAVAQSAGLATTAKNLGELRRALSLCKNRPCAACDRYGGEAVATLRAFIERKAMPNLNIEAGAVKRAASSMSEDFNPHGFVLAKPDTEPRALHFSFTRTFLFLAIKSLSFLGLTKTLAVSSRHILSHASWAKAEIDGLLTEIDVEIGKKS